MCLNSEGKLGPVANEGREYGRFLRPPPAASTGLFWLGNDPPNEFPNPTRIGLTRLLLLGSFHTSFRVFLRASDSRGSSGGAKMRLEETGAPERPETKPRMNHVGFSSVVCSAHGTELHHVLLNMSRQSVLCDHNRIFVGGRVRSPKSTLYRMFHRKRPPGAIQLRRKPCRKERENQTAPMISISLILQKLIIRDRY